jgi:adenosylcobinamide-GDP ribazoletransferase
VIESVRAATGLLTRLPIGVRSDRTGASAFAVVGVGIGVLGVVVAILVGSIEPTLGAVLAVGVMALASGGLPLDGLADTADALAAPDPGRAEVARADPSVGSAGVIALVVVLGAQIAALASLASGPVGPLAVACVGGATAARVVPVLGGLLLRGRAGPDGFGAWFVRRLRRFDVVISLLVLGGVLAVGWAAGVPVPVILAVASAPLVGTVALAWIVARRGQLDGDALGASVELTMLAGLAIAAIVA